MAIAYDTSSNLAESTTSASWTHTPVGTPRGVIVLISNAGLPQTSAITYGGVALTNVVAIESTGELGSVSVWFLGTGLGTGAQTVSVTRTDTDPYIAAAVTVTAAQDTEIVTSDSGYIASANTPTSSLTIPSGVEVFMAGSMYSGENALASITDGADLTRIHEVDFGIDSAVLSRRTNIYTGTGAAYTGFSWTQSSDDLAWAIVAVKESAPTHLGDVAVSVSGSYAAEGVSSKPLTATGVTVSPTAVSTPMAMVKTSAATGITSSPAVAAAGLVTDTGIVALTVSPVVAAAGERTKTATFELWESGVFKASLGAHTVSDTGTVLDFDLTPHVGSLSDNTGNGIEIRMTASGSIRFDAAEWESWHVSTGTVEHFGDAPLTISPTTAAAGYVTDTAAASLAVFPTTAAAGLVTDTGTASLTITPTTASAGTVTDTGTANLTVSPAPLAAGLVSSSRAATLTITPTTTANGASSKPGSASITVSPTTAASLGAVTKTGSASVTTTPAVTSAGYVNDEGIADLTVSPVPAAAGTVTDLATASLTVSPISSATMALSTSTTANLTVSPAPLASATVDKSSVASLTISPIPSATLGAKDISGATALTVSPISLAAAITWRTQFMRPDAILSMSGLTGTYTDIQDSPSSPGITELAPTGGAIDVRFSFENHTQQLRTETGDQTIRVLVTTP